MKRLKGVLSDVLKIEQDRITEELSPKDVESWDSMNGLILVSRLEKVFKVRFTAQEIVDVENVSDIKRVLEKHGVKIEAN